MRANAETSGDAGRAVVRDRVLVVTSRSDDRADDLGQLLAAQGCIVTLTPSVPTGEGVADYLLAILRTGPDAVAMGERLRRLREQAPNLVVAVIGAPGRVADAVEAMRAQALDYLEDPVSAEAVERLMRRARLRTRTAPSDSPDESPTPDAGPGP